MVTWTPSICDAQFTEGRRLYSFPYTITIIVIDKMATLDFLSVSTYLYECVWSFPFMTCSLAHTYALQA